ncbi:MAG: beta-ketoacyl-ACP synthase [Pseudomonadota bacterium]
MTRDRRSEVWIVGVGLVSSLGEGTDAHCTALSDQAAPPRVTDEARFPGYAIHPLADIDFSRQIAKASDQRQMERWQRIGVYAAGLAIDDAGLRGEPALLDATDLAIAAGNGERDLAFDTKVLETADAAPIHSEHLNTLLSTGLRPTLYLGELSNLLAGNISIVHHVTGGSRTFKGEEAAGFAALGDAFRRIEAGQTDRVLVGGALNAERADLLLNLEIGNALWHGAYRPIGERQANGGGMVPGSIGAFLVLERAESAVARGAKPYARLAAVVADQCPRAGEGDIAASLGQLMTRLERASVNGTLVVLSGASGVQPATGEERRFLSRLAEAGRGPVVRTYGNAVGHGVEAHFVSGVALGALGLCKGTAYRPLEAGERAAEGAAAPSHALVTGVGHWRGEALALLEACGRDGA